MKFKKTIIAGTIALALFSTAPVFTTSNSVQAAATTTKIQASAESDQTQTMRLANPKKVTVAYSPNLSAQVKSQIKYAMKQWNSTKIVNLINYSGDDPYQANIYVSNNNPTTDSWGYSLNASVSTNDSNVRTLIWTKIDLDSGLRAGQYDNAAVAHTILHEMGHALGMPDNYQDPNAIMYHTSDYISGVDPTVKLDASDYQILKQLYASEE
ncbi:M57 family metalloprotease [Companilactobacillus sp.]|jgi:predicted Zn-dependent protease|uniref:M57 family metalloprotease n=1 Tax=Companilactobacillus sp. TaxID=2767905 RepID=UPI0025BA9A62|nr:matrixin family metalloprotease [Companilactobacillus sp.]MCH4009867.1 matrixin family metalloprotease [Companilactobacillus sp.]MCH4052457.1 matrixin family metalloprotease [Companilactobacillus sp.]MCH4077809.1 matrixin family metalloprotease [Companilactobacillus sp.]MCH4126385.1 matrixin family metalloprotease [Companilactobacillus sp.]MCI1312707.1 matrixin family metalloprotease [Companilactobacillus sp.]